MKQKREQTQQISETNEKNLLLHDSKVKTIRITQQQPQSSGDIAMHTGRRQSKQRYYFDWRIEAFGFVRLRTHAHVVV